MRIDEFSIRRYGPLPDTGRISLSNFNLFFGKNEDGKTLIIDALVKKLFGRGIWVFEQIGRVDEDPDGYVIIEDDKGKKIKLPEKGDLTKIAGLSPSECRNIFIIRNSDLSIASPESEFYINVTDRLTGLRTREISSVKETLQEIGMLTRADSNASLSDVSKWGKIKTRRKEAKELIKNINGLEREVKEENFDRLEEESSKVTDKISEIEQTLSELENARKRERYEKGDDALRKLRTALENIKGLNSEEIKKLESKLNAYEEERENLSSLEPKSKFFTSAVIISVVVLLASIIGVIIRPLSLLFYLGVLFTISTVILGLFKFSFVIKEVHLSTTQKEIRSSALQLGVDGENVEDIRLNIQKVDRDLKSKEEMEIRLDSHFGKRSRNLGENLSYWNHEIDVLKDYKDKAKGINYDENEASQLESKRKTLFSEKEQIQKKMKGFGEKLKEIERKANEILRLEEDYLHCDTSVDLNGIRDKIENFIEEIENNKDNVLEVMKIFEGIEKEEEEKVSHLFGKDSPISKYFCEITSGTYEKVEFIPDERKIQVRLKDGDILDAEKLSGGAYDQLYLSIRLALGEKLLKGNKGFFIMDDPFVKADKERLQKQIDILRSISEAGWQIMYFTAKDEVRDVLKEDVKSNKVNYVEIQPMYSRT